MISKRFAFVGLPVAILAAAVLIGAYRFVVLTNLQSSVEAVAASMAQIFANTLWQDYGSLVADSGGMTADAIRIDARTLSLDREVRKIAAGTRVLKVKVYSPLGLTLYSTDFAQIGGNYWTESNFQVAIAGGVASRLTRKPEFQSIDGPRRNLVVLESYIPARSPARDGKIVAVLEIYSDVTDLEAGILERPEAIAAMVVVLTVLLASFGVHVWLLRRVERRWLDEQAQRLKLTADFAIEAEASRAKSAFLANMSHELRTPLNAIIGFAEILQTQAFGRIGEPRYVEYASHIHSAGKHLLGVVSEVLDLTQIEAGKTKVSLENIDIRRVLRAAVDMVQETATQKSLTVRLEASSEIPEVSTDERRLRQVVLNILTNAIKYTPPNGTIEIAAAFDARRESVRITITDTGVGMSELELAVAFTPFGRVSNRWAERQDGTGLGLPIAKRTLDILGGSLDIKSKAGAGTTATITLPVGA